MCLSVVITGPICLFNGGNIIASLQSVFYGTRGLHMLQLHCDWRDATDLHGIRAALQPKCLFTHTFNSDRVSRVKAEEAGGPPPSRAERGRGPGMICVRLAPARVSTQRCSVKVCTPSGQTNWQARAASLWEGDVFTEWNIYMNGLLYAPQNMVFITQKHFSGLHFVPCPLQKYRR